MADSMEDLKDREAIAVADEAAADAEIERLQEELRMLKSTILDSNPVPDRIKKMSGNEIEAEIKK